MVIHFWVRIMFGTGYNNACTVFGFRFTNLISDCNCSNNSLCILSLGNVMLACSGFVNCLVIVNTGLSVFMDHTL